MRVARNGVPIGILSSNRTTYRSLLAVFLWLYFTLWLSRTAVWKSSLEKIFSTRRASYSQGRSVILFLAPKQGFSLIPSQIVAWQNVLQSIGGRIVLLLNERDDIALAELHGFQTERLQESSHGLPLLDSILHTMSGYRLSDAVGFCNSDISPGEGFGKALISTLSALKSGLQNMKPYRIDSNLTPIVLSDRRERGWLIVLSRVDFDVYESDGQTHMGGGVDFWLWNNVARHNNIFGSASAIPAFRIARPWFDNWITSTALQVGGRHVIDGTRVLKVYHRKHKRLGNIASWDDPRYLKKLKLDPDWLQNEKFAKVRVRTVDGSFSSYSLGIGTTCEALYTLFEERTQNGTRVRVAKGRTSLVPCPSCPDCYSDKLR